MTRGRRRTGYHGSGLASSSMENECPRCGNDIQDWRQATKVKGRWIHKTCAGGGDE